MKVSNCYIVYNSGAGKNNAGKLAEKIKEELINRTNANCTLFESSSKEKDFEFAQTLEETENSLIIVLGGDGTLGAIVRCLILAEKDLPIAVFPSGTANDFAHGVKIPKRVKKFVSLILSSEPVLVDCINVNGDDYAINALGAGNFTNGVTIYSARLKKLFGKFGYYFKCIADSFKMKSAFLNFKTDGEEFSAETLMYYATNSKCAGGFHHFAKNADVSDGEWDLVVVKKCGFWGCVSVFFSILFGSASKNKHIITRRIKTLEVTGGEENKKFYRCDIDGNPGPEGTLKAEVLNKKVKIFTNLNNL